MCYKSHWFSLKINLEDYNVLKQRGKLVAQSESTRSQKPNNKHDQV